VFRKQADDSSGRLAPGPIWGPYPMRASHLRRGLTDAWRDRLSALDGRRGSGAALAVLRRAQTIDHDGQPLDALRSSAAGGRMPRLDALAVACVAARRTLGFDPYPSQVQAAATMLDGGLAELATGEGKTLALALAAAAQALDGTPVHVVSVNDYLVERDAVGLSPLYQALGLSVDRVLQSDDPARRRIAYRADVVYSTGRELMFDYLRDRMAGIDHGGLEAHAEALRDSAGAKPLLRGLCCALIDEADSILIDEATLPCILAVPVSAQEAAFTAEAIRLARGLWQGRDYLLDAQAGSVRLTDAGATRLRELTGVEGPDIDTPLSENAQFANAQPDPAQASWRLERIRHDRIGMALAALHCYQRDRDYLVHEGRVEIVDRHTGRIASGRTWSRGLHQMIEIKEGVELTAPHETASRIAAQQFFARYWRIGGLSATLWEARHELAGTYGLTVTAIAPRHHSRRRDLGTRLFPTTEGLHAAVLERTRSLAADGRPVLVATRDVAESEQLAAAMRAEGIEPTVLNARHDREEADIVAKAGISGRVTIATNMAGRGTDIALDAAAIAAGGLAMVATCLQPSRRLDRQLQGRSGRRGEPGTVETLASVEAPIAGVSNGRPPLTSRLATLVASRFAPRLLRAIQRSEEKKSFHERRRLYEQDVGRERSHVLGHIDE
jgi:preprotein translocase subunit SecA